jgi:aerobic carbon-monoxide dehydrogenase small subunit
MAAKALLESNPSPSREEVLVALSGNVCRCTGYQFIVDAVLAAASKVQSAEQPIELTNQASAHLVSPTSC